MVRIAKSVVNKSAELKYFDRELQVNADWSGSIDAAPTTLITQGDTQNQRQGSKIMIKGVRLSYKFQGNIFATTAVQNFKIMIIGGRGENETTFLPSNIIQTTGSVYAVKSPKTFNKSRRYKVYYSKIVSVAGGWTGTPGFPDQRTITTYVKVNYPVTFTTGGGTTINNGGIYILVIGEETSGGTNGTCQYTCRVYFTDL